MASGYEVNGTDLDSIFAPWHSGWPQAAATDYQVAGADLNARYAPLSTGSAAAATNIRVNGTDLNAIFAALGTTGVQVGAQPSNVSGSAAAGNPSGTVTSGSTSCAGTKGSGSYTYTWHTTSCSATNELGASTTFYASVNAGSTVNGSAYCAISDGVTSVNTNTISVTLQNTTPPVNGTFEMSSSQSSSGTPPNETIATGFGPGLGALISNGIGWGTPYEFQTIYDVSSGTTTTYLAVTAATQPPSDAVTGVSVTEVGIGPFGTLGAPTSYSYAGGVATWTWNNTNFWTTSTSGNDFDVTIYGV